MDFQSDSEDGLEDDSEVSGGEDNENQNAGRSEDINGGHSASVGTEAIANRDSGASSTDQQEIPEVAWAEETNPSLERMGMIRDLLLTSRLVL